MGDIFILEEYMNAIGIELNQKQKDQFLIYYNLLIEWNKNINLTAITDFDDVMLKHFADSLLVSKVYDMNTVNTLIDVGTGAGFPGIPIKIIFPHIEVVLLDSLNKRIKFLNEVIEKLGLDSISAIHDRAEDIGHNVIHRNHYDLCVSRAVANLATLSEYCLPLVKVKGRFISFKSGDILEELENSKRAIEVLGGEIKNCPVLNLIDTDIQRSFVVINKFKETPKNYPRKAGKPSKEPIV
jgi:16S rRNA (guanine527-N7)-methyltransferase